MLHPPKLHSGYLAAFWLALAAAGAAQTYTTVLQSNETIPAAGAPVNGFRLPPRLNAGGQVAIMVGMGPGGSLGTGILQGTAGAWRQVLRRDLAAPGVAGQTISSITGGLLVQSDQGRIMACGETSGGKSCLWAEDGNGGLLAAVEGGVAGDSPDSRWTSDLADDDDKRFSNSGLVGMTVHLTVTNDSDSDRTSAWWGPPQDLHLIARRKVAPPGIQNFFDGNSQPYYLFQDFYHPFIGSNGRVAFMAKVYDRTNGQFIGQGIWERQTINLPELRYYNYSVVSVPNGGAVRQQQQIDLLGYAGGPVLLSQPVDTTPPVTRIGGSLFSDAGGGLKFETGYPGAVQGVADAVVGTYGGGAISPSGRIVTMITAPGLNQPHPTISGVTLDGYGYVSGVGGNYTVVALNNTQAPGLASGVKFAINSQFVGLDNTDDFRPALTPQGRLMFMTRLQGTGVTSANNKALWLSQPGGGLQLMARTGQVLPTPNGNRTLTDFQITTGSGGDDGLPRAHNDAGQVAFRAIMNSGPELVVIAAGGATVPLAGSGSGLPELAIAKGPAAGQITLSWTTDQAGVVLQESTTLGSWVTAVGTVAHDGNNYSLAVSTAAPPKKFFRLFKP